MRMDTDLHDQRVTTLTRRMDALEGKQNEMDTKMDGLVHDVSQLGVSMSTQFSQVIASIRSLADSQSEGGEDTSRKRQATSANGSS